MPGAIVVGGGIAGLASATALERAGWSVQVHEQASEIRPLGAALSLWPNATAALDRLGLLGAVTAAAAPLRAMFVGDQCGRAIMAARPITERALMVTRSALQDCLAGGVQGSVELGNPVETVAQDRDGVTVHFADGRAERADLLVDAAGIWSPVAAAAIGGQASYRGYGGVIALSDPVDGTLDGVASEYWGRHEPFGLFEIAGNRRYWFYMRTAGADAPAPSHAELTRIAASWPKGIAEAVGATPPERLIAFVIHAKPPPKRLGVGRVICVGDAAHAMEPNLGQGACQALEDAVALGVLARDTPPAAILPAFEALRLKRVATIVKRAAEGRMAAHGPPVLQYAMRTALRVMPRALVDRITRDGHTMPEYRA